MIKHWYIINRRSAQANLSKFVTDGLQIQVYEIWIVNRISGGALAHTSNRAVTYIPTISKGTPQSPENHAEPSLNYFMYGGC
jgi:hypothetical protein